MEINSDFNQRVVVHAAQLDWSPSPMRGVERQMLAYLHDFGRSCMNFGTPHKKESVHARETGNIMLSSYVSCP